MSEETIVAIRYIWSFIVMFGVWFILLWIIKPWKRKSRYDMKEHDYRYVDSHAMFVKLYKGRGK